MTKRLENELRFDERYDLSITNSRKKMYALGYHAKEAFNKLGRFVKRGGIAAVLAGAIGTAGCPLPVPNPVDYTPEAIVSVSPTSGLTSVPRQIQVNGQSPDTYVSFKAFADYNNNEIEDSGEELVAPQSTPIDTLYTFTTPGTFDVHGIVTDQAGKAAESRSPAITVSPPTATPPPEQPPVNPPADTDYENISVRVESDETHQSLPKTLVRIYDAHNPHVIAANNSNDPNVFADNYAAATVLQEVETSNGNVSVTLDKLVSQLPGGVVLRARGTNSDWANGTTYARTVIFPKGNVTSSTMRVVPYPTEDINGDGIPGDINDVNDFVLDERQTNGDFMIKYAIQDVDTLTSGFDDSTFSTGTNSEVSMIETKVAEWNNAITNNGLLSRQTIDTHLNDPSIPYTLNNSGYPVAKNGWLIVVPDKKGTKPPLAPENGGYWEGTGEWGTYAQPGGTIYFQNVFAGGVSHELGHGLGFPDHSEKLNSEIKSIMYYLINNPNATSPAAANKKGMLRIYEETFKGGESYLATLATN